MRDLYNVKLDPSARGALVSEFVERLAAAFDQDVQKIKQLLAADTMLLTEQEAKTVVMLGRETGVEVRIGRTGKRLLPSPFESRRRAFLLGLVLIILLLLALVLVFFREDIFEAVAGSKSTSASLDATSIVAVPPGAELARGDGVTATSPSATVPDTTSEPLAAPPANSTAPAGEADLSLFITARDGTAADLRAELSGVDNVDQRDSYGQTPLMYAAGRSNSEMVQLLLDAGADVNARSDAGWTPLMYAARDNTDIAVAFRLIQAGADLRAANESGETALEIARASGNRAVADLIADSRAPLPLWSRETVEAVTANSPAITTTTNTQSADPAAAQNQQSGPATLVTTSRETAPAGEAQRSLDDDPSREVLQDCLEDWASCGNEP